MSNKAARFFKVGDKVTDNPNGGKIGEVIEVDGALVTVDWGVHTMVYHYTDLDHAD
jgi:hypothetical protein